MQERGWRQTLLTISCQMTRLLNMCVVNMSSKNAGAGVASDSADNQLQDDASIEYMCSKYE